MICMCVNEVIDPNEPRHQRRPEVLTLLNEADIVRLYENQFQERMLTVVELANKDLVYVTNSLAFVHNILLASEHFLRLETTKINGEQLPSPIIEIVNFDYVMKATAVDEKATEMTIELRTGETLTSKVTFGELYKDLTGKVFQ